MPSEPDWARDPEDRPVARAILGELARRRLSQAALARELGVTPAHLGMVLAARRTSHALLDDAARALGLGLPTWSERMATATGIFLRARDKALATGASRDDAWNAGYRAKAAWLTAQ